MRANAGACVDDDDDDDDDDDEPGIRGLEATRSSAVSSGASKTVAASYTSTTKCVGCYNVLASIAMEPIAKHNIP